MAGQSKAQTHALVQEHGIYAILGDLASNIHEETNKLRDMLDDDSLSPEDKDALREAVQMSEQLEDAVYKADRFALRLHHRLRPIAGRERRHQAVQLLAKSP